MCYEFKDCRINTAVTTLPVSPQLSDLSTKFQQKRDPQLILQSRCHWNNNNISVHKHTNSVTISCFLFVYGKVWRHFCSFLWYFNVYAWYLPKFREVDLKKEILWHQFYHAARLLKSLKVTQCGVMTRVTFSTPWAQIKEEFAISWIKLTANILQEIFCHI